MATGVFVKAVYEGEKTGQTFNVRVQPETLEFVLGGLPNVGSVSAATQKYRARISGSQRSLGVHTRKIRVKVIGAVPPEYTDRPIFSIPCLNRALWDSLDDGLVGLYLGLNVEYVGSTPEYAK